MGSVDTMNTIDITSTEAMDTYQQTQTLVQKRGLDDFDDTQNTRPRTEHQYIANKIKDIVDTAFDACSRITPDEMHKLRSANKHCNNYTDHEIREMNGVVPAKISLNSAFENDTLSVKEFCTLTTFSAFGKWLNPKVGTDFDRTDPENIIRTSIYQWTDQNRDVEFYKYISANVNDLVEEFLSHVPTSYGDLHVLPEQILMSLYINTALPIDTYITTTNPTTKETAKLIVNAHTKPTVDIVPTMPGSGKTCMAYMSIRHGLTSEKCANMFRNINSINKKPVSGGFHVPLSEKTLTRCMVYGVPVAIKDQTFASAYKFLANSGIRIINGLKDGGVDWDMKKIHELGIPVLWILPLNRTFTDALSKEPSYSYYALYLDELNAAYNRRGDPSTSSACHTVIIQATPQKLNDSVKGRPKALLRTEYCNGRGEIYMEEPMIRSAFLHGMPPDAVRLATNRAAIERMPRRFKLFTVAATGVNLNRMFNNGNAPLAPRSLADNFHTLVPVRETTFSQSVMDEFKNRLRGGGGVIGLSNVRDIMIEVQNAIRTPERERNTMSNLTRLVANLTQVTESQLECPIMLTPIDEADARVLPCCSNVISDAASRGIQRNVCPMCRTVGNFTLQAVPTQNMPCAIERPGLSMPLREALQEISNKKLPTVAALHNTLQAALDNDPSCRIVLSALNSVESTTMLQQVACDLRATHPRLELHIIGARGKKFRIEKYNDVANNPAPQIVVLNTSDNSNNAQGLDLYATKMTVLLGPSRVDVKIQLIGRCCRMSNDPDEEKMLVNIKY